MASATMQAYLDKVSADPSLRPADSSSAAAVVEHAKSLGFDVTIEEVEAYAADNIDDLDAAAGGSSSNTCYCNIKI